MDRPSKPRRSHSALFGIAIPVLCRAVAQLLFHYRDAVAARWPASKPVLTRACDFVGSTIKRCATSRWRTCRSMRPTCRRTPRTGGAFLIASVRRHAASPLAYLDLEFTLTDTNGTTVVRRFLLPSDYAGGAADLSKGIPANGEVPIELFIDASATTQAGYTLYMFYP